MFRKLSLATVALATAVFFFSFVYIQFPYIAELDEFLNYLLKGPKHAKVVEAEVILNSSVEEFNNKYNHYSYEFDAKVIDYDVNNKRICGLYRYDHQGHIKDLSVHKNMLIEKVQKSHELAEDIKNSTDWDVWIISNNSQIDSTKSRCSEFVAMKTSKI